MAKQLAIVKQYNVEVEGEIVAEVMYNLWVGDDDLEPATEWEIGVKLTKEQALRAEETNASEEPLTEGYYITELDRFGELYYRMSSEQELIMTLLKKYDFVLER